MTSGAAGAAGAWTGVASGMFYLMTVRCLVVRVLRSLEGLADLAGLEAVHLAVEGLWVLRELHQPQEGPEPPGGAAGSVALGAAAYKS